MSNCPSNKCDSESMFSCSCSKESVVAQAKAMWCDKCCNWFQCASIGDKTDELMRLKHQVKLVVKAFNGSATAV